MAHQAASGRQTYPPPAADFANSDEDDDYESDGDAELNDDDVNILNTDYDLQKNLTFFPPHISGDNQPSAYSKSSQTYARDPRLPSIPTRDASLRHRESLSQQEPPYRVPSRKSQAYQYPTSQPRPLIDYIKNEWQQAALPTSTAPIKYRRSAAPRWIRIFSAPRLRRGVFILSISLFMIYANWLLWLGPSVRQSRGLRRSSLERLKNADGWFGQNLRPEFAETIHLDTLEETLLPGSKGVAPERRLIFIGDVHGCNDELNALLTAADYRPRQDHLVFTGDLIAKGPNSAAVLDLAISHNASCVRGNHEDRFLLTHRDLSIHAGRKEDDPPEAGVPAEASTPELTEEQQKLMDDPTTDNEIEEFLRLDIADRKLAKTLTQKHVDYLSNCPLILDVGHVPSLGNVHVAHAGLIPSIGLESQDPVSVMHMRTIDLETHVPSEKSKGTPWFKLWNKYQSLVPSARRATVIYGHDSKRGLQLGTYTKGLDTGCVKGGKLTALIVDGSSSGDPRTVDVPCKDYRKLERDRIKEGAGSKEEKPDGEKKDDQKKVKEKEKEEKKPDSKRR